LETERGEAGVSDELYSVLALGMRYWFIALGLLIVVQTFLWLYRDHREKHRRLKNLPDAGMIGEFVVLSGSKTLEEGRVIPVPWEGMMGSSGACDVVVPSPEFAPVHLYFSFVKGRGLQIETARGRSCYVDGVLQEYRKGTPDGKMIHGSILQVGDCVLRLRLFAGLDVERKAARKAEDDLKEYGMPVASQGVPRQGYDGWVDPQTEEERFTGIYLVKDEEQDGNEETKKATGGSRKKNKNR